LVDSLTGWQEGCHTYKTIAFAKPIANKRAEANAPTLTNSPPGLAAGKVVTTKITKNIGIEQKQNLFPIYLMVSRIIPFCQPQSLGRRGFCFLIVNE